VTGRRDLLLAALAASLAACAPRTQAELLEVSAVGPARIEPGHRLRVSGNGFPPGRAAHIRIEGVARRPGQEDREVAVEIEGRAVSSEEIEARFTRSALDALGGRATLTGRARVAFDATDGGTVIGRSPEITLDVMPSAIDGLDREIALRQSAVMLVQSLGLALGEESPERDGLPVESVDEGSPAARAGIAPGDRIVTFGGVRAHALSDLAPAPGASRAVIQLARDGELAPFEVRIALDAPRGLSPAAMHLLAIAFAWLLAIALFLAPSASIADAFVPAPRFKSPPIPGGKIRRALRRYAPIAIRALTAISILVAIVALSRAHPVHVPLEAAILCLIALRVSTASIEVDRTRRFARTRAIAGSLGASLAIATAFASAAALGGTTDLRALHDLSGALPWEWIAARSPAGPLMLAAVVYAGSWRAHPGARTAGIIDEVLSFALATFAALVLLGGFHPSEGPTVMLRAIGTAAFALKVLLLWTAMRNLRERGARHPLAWAALSIGAALLTTAWIAWEPPSEIEAAFGRAIAMVFAAYGVWILYRHLARTPRARLEPSHPYA
jgi:hypothetical protein